MNSSTTPSMPSPNASRRKMLGASAVWAGLQATGLGSAQAQQAWPAKPVRIVVPFSPGGSGDRVSRLVGRQLEKQTGEKFMVENRPGAAGTVAAAYVLTAPGDGYTLLSISPTFVITKYVYPNLKYDAQRDFKAVGLAVQTPLVFVVKPSLGVRTPAEFLALAKKEPSRLTYSSVGKGSIVHLAADELCRKAGIEMRHIPYKGGAESMFAVVSGEVDSAMLHPLDLYSYPESGKLVVIGATGKERWANLAKVPTFAEAGVADFEVIHFSGFAMRGDTPADVLAKVSDQIQRALKDAEFRKMMSEFGAVPMGTIGEAEARIAAEHKLWARVVKDSGSTLE